MQWIRIEDELPPKDISVLIYQDPYISTAEYWHDEGDVHVFMNYAPYECVTHWMPLPEPPSDTEQSDS